MWYNPAKCYYWEEDDLMVYSNCSDHNVVVDVNFEFTDTLKVTYAHTSHLLTLKNICFTYTRALRQQLTLLQRILYEAHMHSPLHLES